MRVGKCSYPCTSSDALLGGMLDVSVGMLSDIIAIASSESNLELVVETTDSGDIPSGMLACDLPACDLPDLIIGVMPSIDVDVLTDKSINRVSKGLTRLEFTALSSP